jgi:hypothetical protein
MGFELNPLYREGRQKRKKEERKEGRKEGRKIERKKKGGKEGRRREEGKKKRHKKLTSRAGGVAQVVECLPRKHEAPVPPKKLTRKDVQ